MGIQTATRTVALAGNPNSGKTTVFNGLTGSNQTIGNWPGVTVERKEGFIKTGGSRKTIVDLPGIYTLSAESEDERVTRDYVLSGQPDLVLNVVDSTNLERNLYLTLQLIEMEAPLLIVLTMKDLARERGITVDEEELSLILGCPVISVNALEGSEMNQVKEEITKALDSPSVSPVRVPYPEEFEGIIARWSGRLADFSRSLNVSPRWTAVQLLEGDPWVRERVPAGSELTEEELSRDLMEAEAAAGKDTDIICAESKYALIRSIRNRVLRKTKEKVPLTDRIDRVALHRIFGVPIFLGIMYMVFWTTINLGGAFIDFFDILFGTIFVDGFTMLLESISAPVWLIAMLAGGIGGGIQTVATFIPIIFTMFFMLSLLEDSGYMARAAFLMDRFMQTLGLPGKAFVPMLVGFGCTVPAIMATRTLESRKDRFMTIFMAPLMSCGARLPVYILFAAAFFPGSAGLVVFSLYLFGIVLSVVTGLLLKNTVFRGDDSRFIMELPQYHPPRIRPILRYSFRRLQAFVIRAGKAITLMVAVLGFLNSFGTDGSLGNEDSENSMLSAVGKTITPVFAPMGVEQENWPATVALFTGIFAKEAVVGTLNGLYGQLASGEDGEVDSEGAEEAVPAGTILSAGITEAFATIPANLAGLGETLTDPLGIGAVFGAENEETAAEEVAADASIFTALRGAFTHGKAQAYAYMLFVLIYFPCVAAFGAAAREMGFAWAALSAGYLTVLAWAAATLVFQIFVSHQLLWIVTAVLLLGGLVGMYTLIGKYSKLSFIREKRR